MTKIERLKSISIRDFRSLGGQVDIQLDASVVLVHGPNGAGKTSVLSALELALSGSVDSMRRVDAKYHEHLVHYGAENAAISLEVAHEDGSVGAWDTTSDSKGWARDHYLKLSDAEFYRERSYLAQATLGRLLEIYDAQDSSHGSALTKFVNEVLGLDELEALIDGLADSKDIRNIRNLVPGIAGLDGDVKILESRRADNRQRIATLAAEIEQLEGTIRDEVDRSLRAERLDDDTDPIEAVTAEAADATDEALIVKLTGMRREIESIGKSLEGQEQSAFGPELLEAERRLVLSSELLMDWRAGLGVGLETIFESVRSEFREMFALEDAGPNHTLETLLEMIRGECARISAAVYEDDLQQKEVEDLHGRIELAIARRAIVSEQIAAELSEAGDISRIMIELIPHLNTEECFVCGRDYSEISDEPLAVQASRRVAKFSAQAVRVNELSQARVDVLAEIEHAREKLVTTTDHLLSDSDRFSLVSRLNVLRPLEQQLISNKQQAQRGENLLVDYLKAREELNRLRHRSQNWKEMENAVAVLARDLVLGREGDEIPLRRQFERVENEIRYQISILEAKIGARRHLTELSRKRRLVLQDRFLAEAEHEQLTAASQRLQRKKVATQTARDEAKSILSSAVETHATMVNEVFNESLNSVWRDLFVRLAPSEPFVPAFRVSSQSRRTSPQLVTNHRTGGEGGSPGAMLSSGNLNTAALTLFLAIHLSSGDRLPLIVLDDPVQSMDDVHISQFAALLRTLSKQHGRQIVVAVHERALFDYLALELSPAFPSDSLITVELTKRENGSTVAACTPHEWHEDSVSAAS